MNLRKVLKKVSCFLCMVTIMLTSLQLTRNTVDVKADDRYTYEQLKEMFPDEKLLKVIYSTLEYGVNPDIEEGDSVLVSELESISRLKIEGTEEDEKLYDTIDLTGISNLKNLKSFILRYYNIENETLKNFAGLEINYSNFAHE